MRDSEAPLPKAENIKIWMPSDLPASERIDGCKLGLPDMEVRLREAQCSDALDRLRSRLHAKSHLILFRNANITGQGATTRARSLISSVGDRITACAAKYTRGREALIALKGSTFYETRFRELTAEHIKLDTPNPSDIAARRRLGSAGGNAGPRAPRGGSGRAVMSWIWTAEGGPTDQDASLHNCK